MPTPTSPRRRSILRTLGAGLTTLILGVGGVELIARQISPAPGPEAMGRNHASSRLFQQDADLTQVPRPNTSVAVWDPEWQSTVSINSLGMRGPLPPSLPANGKRVLALGDSLTFAMQVDDSDTFVRKIETTLSTETPTTVWNAGVDNYSTMQAANRAKREVERGVHFDAILLTFFMGNDLLDNARAHRNPHDVNTRQRDRFEVPVSPLEVSSGSVALAWAVLLFDRLKTAGNPRFASVVKKDLQIWCDADALDAVLPKTAHSLDVLSSLARHHQIPLVIALAPPEWVINPVIGARVTEWLELDEFDPDSVPRALKAAIHPSATVVDLTPALRRAREQSRITFRYDAHWTAIGHAAVAEALAPSVRQALVHTEVPRPDRIRRTDRSEGAR